jgi:shikimate kinase
MGTGKTETGKIIAKMLNRCFFDTDDLIEKKVGFTISAIFEKFGELYFRQTETEVIKEMTKKSSVVISCGGGTTLNPLNVDMLKSGGIIVNLCASAETIYGRIKKKHTRPLLKCEDSLSTIKRILYTRKNAYKNCDFTFNTDELTASEVANSILNDVNIRKLLKI